MTPIDVDQTANLPEFLRVVPTVVVQEGNQTPELIEGTTRVFEYFTDHPQHRPSVRLLERQRH